MEQDSKLVDGRLNGKPEQAASDIAKFLTHGFMNGDRKELPLFAFVVGISISLILWVLLAGLAWFITSNLP